MNRPRLTRRLLKDLCDRVRGGAFEHVACESLGVPYETYLRWLGEGSRPDAPRLCAALVHEVTRARAAARLLVEIEMRKEQPKVWLLQGPGRETPTRPGWTSPAKANQEDGAADARQLREELDALVAAVYRALKPFPEARAAVVQALGTPPASEE